MRIREVSISEIDDDEDWKRVAILLGNTDADSVDGYRDRADAAAMILGAVIFWYKQMQRDFSRCICYAFSGITTKRLPDPEFVFFQRVPHLIKFKDDSLCLWFRGVCVFIAEVAYPLQ